MSHIILEPIGLVRSSRKAMEDDNWDTETAWVELNKDNFSPEALKGLDAFSHAEIIFYMDKVDPKKVEKTARSRSI